MDLHTAVHCPQARPGRRDLYPTMVRPRQPCKMSTTNCFPLIVIATVCLIVIFTLALTKRTDELYTGAQPSGRKLFIFSSTAGQL